VIVPKALDDMTFFAPDTLLGGQAADAGASGGDAGGEGGDAGGEGDAGEGGAAGGEGGSSAPEWLGSLSEDIRADESLAAYESLDDLAKSHLELKGKVPVIPEKADGYTPPDGVMDELKGMEGVDADGVIKAWQENAHKYGMRPETAQKLLQDEIKNAKEAKGKQEERLSNHIKESVQKTTEALKQEWKGDFQANLDAADQALSRIFSQPVIDAIKLSGMAFNKDFILDLHKLSPHVTEDMIDNLGGAKQAAAEVKKSIADRMYK